MKRLTFAVTAMLVLIATTAFGGFGEGVRLEAGGKAIDVKVGHLVPCVADWNGDGAKDLIVGQFSGGKIRLYLNRGSDAEPRFEDSTLMEAGGAQISLPAG